MGEDLVQKSNQYLRLISSIVVVGGMIIGMILWPTHKKIESVEGRVENLRITVEKVEDEQDKIRKEIDEKLKDKVSSDILRLHLSPIQEDIGEIKENLKILLQLYRKNNGG